MPVCISYDGGSFTQLINIKTIADNVGWVSLETHLFSVGTGWYVVVSDNADGVVVADAVKWGESP